MSPEQRAAFLDACIESADGWVNRNWIALRLDQAANEFGCTVTHPSVRDHTDCDVCHGGGGVVDSHDDAMAYLRGEPVDLRPCPAGRLVPWEPEGGDDGVGN